MKLTPLVLIWFLLSGCMSNPDKWIHREVHTGEIAGYSYDEYSLSLSENDQLTTSIDIDRLDVIIYSPVNTVMENNKPIIIETGGTYILRVLMPRAFARKNEKFQYKLLITIDRI
ncbi:hypothetical protein [Microbulbifer sp. TYP-18]|uniref:hypothetical protein n=1 Tax=Microbulbifer sp. TYP-18 TaxID=3230024 RepID=UPI0034C641C0